MLSGGGRFLWWQEVWKSATRISFKDVNKLSHPVRHLLCLLLYLPGRAVKFGLQGETKLHKCSEAKWCPSVRSSRACAQTMNTFFFCEKKCSPLEGPEPMLPSSTTLNIQEDAPPTREGEGAAASCKVGRNSEFSSFHLRETPNAVAVLRPRPSVRRTDDGWIAVSVNSGVKLAKCCAAAAAVTVTPPTNSAFISTNAPLLGLVEHKNTHNGVARVSLLCSSI